MVIKQEVKYQCPGLVACRATHQIPSHIIVLVHVILVELVNNVLIMSIVRQACKTF